MKCSRGLIPYRKHIELYAEELSILAPQLLDHLVIFSFASLQLLEALVDLSLALDADVERGHPQQFLTAVCEHRLQRAICGNEPLGAVEKRNADDRIFHQRLPFFLARQQVMPGLVEPFGDFAMSRSSLGDLDLKSFVFGAHPLRKLVPG
jgi:hypothetical protein